jgi:hypothetical protein
LKLRNKNGNYSEKKKRGRSSKSLTRKLRIKYMLSKRNYIKRKKEKDCKYRKKAINKLKNLREKWKKS